MERDHVSLFTELNDLLSEGFLQSHIRRAVDKIKKEDNTIDKASVIKSLMSLMIEVFLPISQLPPQIDPNNVDSMFNQYHFKILSKQHNSAIHLVIKIINLTIHKLIEELCTDSNNELLYINLRSLDAICRYGVLLLLIEYITKPAISVLLITCLMEVNNGDPENFIRLCKLRADIKFISVATNEKLFCF